MVGFALEVSAVNLDEIIARGLAGGAERKKIGVNLPTVDVEKLKEMIPVGGFSQVLEGRVPGVKSVGQLRIRPDFNTESYAHIDENDFRLVSASPLSTFSIDVDRASYANIRRFIQDGQRPPLDAVRVEDVKLAEKGKGDDPRGYRGEFMRLVEATRDLRLLTRETDGLR